MADPQPHRSVVCLKITQNGSAIYFSHPSYQGQIGIVQRVFQDQGLTVYTVQLEGGKRIDYQRSDLKLVTRANLAAARLTQPEDERARQIRALNASLSLPCPRIPIVGSEVEALYFGEWVTETVLSCPESFFLGERVALYNTDN